MVMTDLDTFNDLDALGLRAALEALPTSTLDALPFGVIRLNRHGTVEFFSHTEANLSGFRNNALGLLFFTELAPCLNSPGLRAQIEAGRAASSLDVRFEHIGDYGDADRELFVRMISASDGGIWICLQRQLEPAH